MEHPQDQEYMSICGHIHLSNTCSKLSNSTLRLWKWSTDRSNRYDYRKVPTNSEYASKLILNRSKTDSAIRACNELHWLPNQSED